MALIGSIILDNINKPCDLATALRLILQDSLDSGYFDIENPRPLYSGRKDLNYRFRGDETAFVLGFHSSGAASLRVDVVDFVEDNDDAYSEIIAIIGRLGHQESLGVLRSAVQAKKAAPSGDDDAAVLEMFHQSGLSVGSAVRYFNSRNPTINPAWRPETDDEKDDELLNAWHATDLAIGDATHILNVANMLGKDKAIRRLEQDETETVSDDEQALLDAWHATGLDVREAIEKMMLHINDPAAYEDLDDEPTEPPVEAPFEVVRPDTGAHDGA